MKTLIIILIIGLLSNNSILAQRHPPSQSHSRPPSTIKTTASTTTTTLETTISATTKTTSHNSLPKIITEWKRSIGVGYGDFAADVLSVSYDSTYVYVSTNSIPSYSIGPWSYNPNKPTPQNATFKFYLNPTASTTKTPMRLGAIGLWINGLYIYNGYDGHSFNNLGVWQRDAYVWEGISFDSCNGHPDAGGRYHNHISINCYYDSTDSTQHSPLLGFLLDSYPIYGPFGYSDPYDANSNIKRIRSGYELRDITNRTSLANGTVLSSFFYGPDVNSTYPLGSYLQDYQFTGAGDLDQYNGRWCVTPEFPSGTYAYFITTDSIGKPAYPYAVGGSYYGSLSTTSVKNTIPTTVTQYF